MPVNLDKPHLWKADIACSVDMYNDWFMRFAPEAFRETRIQTTRDVEMTLASTENLTNIRPEILRKWPGVLPTLRMSTCPPLAVDRLIGLAGASDSMIKRMEKIKQLPVRMSPAAIDQELLKVAVVIERLADPDIFAGSSVPLPLRLPKFIVRPPSLPIGSVRPSPTRSFAMPRSSASWPISGGGWKRADTPGSLSARTSGSTPCRQAATASA